MKCVKWIFVVLLTSSLTSFVEKDKSFSGLNVGDVAPGIDIILIDSIEATSSLEKSCFSLSSLKGKYVILSFWASYDADSRIQNIRLNNALKSTPNDNIKMVSISYDKFESVYKETIRKDQIVASNSYWDLEGIDSKIYSSYKLDKGFRNYLLDENGVILAKNISIADLPILTSRLAS